MKQKPKRTLGQACDDLLKQVYSLLPVRLADASTVMPLSPADPYKITLTLDMTREVRMSDLMNLTLSIIENFGEQTDWHFERGPFTIVVTGIQQNLSNDS